MQALSKFFRLSLNKGFDWVSIQTELEHARSYLVIQQMRYHDILTYEISVDRELQDYPILKMTLQPLVENALYHGIKNKRGQGRISIHGYIEENSIILTVQDNGIGMSADRLAQLREELEKPAGSRSPKMTSRKADSVCSMCITGFGSISDQLMALKWTVRIWKEAHL